MTDYVGTVNTPAVAGEVGATSVGLLTYALTGALVNADTIRWTNAIPSKQQARVIDMQFNAPELDTNASPTMTFTVGDGTDADGYITTCNAGLPAQAPANGYPLVAHGNGAIIGTATQAGRDIVFTVTGVVATGATSGTIFIRPVVKAIA